ASACIAENVLAKKVGTVQESAPPRTVLRRNSRRVRRESSFFIRVKRHEFHELTRIELVNICEDSCLIFISCCFSFYVNWYSGVLITRRMAFNIASSSSDPLESR